MPDGSNTSAFQACVRTPFATLGITATDRFVTGIRFLAPSVRPFAPPRNTVAFLACVQLQAYLEDGSYRFDLPLQLDAREIRHRVARRRESAHRRREEADARHEAIAGGYAQRGEGRAHARLERGRAGAVRHATALPRARGSSP